MTVLDVTCCVMYGQDMGERRVETVQVRLTTAEKEALEARAAAVHLSVSEYIRRDLNDRPAQPQRLEPLDTMLERRKEQPSSSDMGAVPSAAAAGGVEGSVGQSAELEAPGGLGEPERIGVTGQEVGLTAAAAQTQTSLIESERQGTRRARASMCEHRVPAGSFCKFCDQ